MKSQEEDVPTGKLIVLILEIDICVQLYSLYDCSTCAEGAWDCGDQDCKTSVSCPNNQVYLEKFQRCGSTCSTYSKKEFCNPNEAFVDGCTCEEGQVLDQNVSVIVRGNT